MKQKMYTIFPRIISAETIQGKKLFKGGNWKLFAEIRYSKFLLNMASRETIPSSHERLPLLGVFCVSKTQIKIAG